MYSFLLFLFIFVSLLMTVAILMQSSKGGGLAASFGGMGGGGGGVFGPRGAANFLQKATTVLATLYLLLCLTIGFVGRSTSGSSESVLQRELQRQQQEAPATTLPVAPIESEPTTPTEEPNQP